MGQSVIVIGGGIAGLSTAFFLLQDGHDVTVIDEGLIENSTSFGNAGFLSGFEKAPLSYPGVILDTLKRMIKAQSPVIIHPNLDSHLLKWLWKFMANANEARLKKTLILFEKYAKRAIDGYRKWIELGMEFDFHQDGALLVFTDRNNYLQKRANATDLTKYDVLSYEEAKDDLGFVKNNIEGIIALKRNARINPAALMHQLKTYLKSHGVKFVLQEEIISLTTSANKVVSIHSKNSTYKADTFVLATGANQAIAKKLGQKLMLVPAKGYSITFKIPQELKPKRVVMFHDQFIIATPRKDDLRITSKLELGTTDASIPKKRIDSIFATLSPYVYPFEPIEPKLWCGFRPLTPNDMPLIGRDEKYKNMVYAMGYGWLGMTFGPALGEILANLITNDLDNSQSDDVLLFSGFYQGC
jgi:D-amino-acid dehydrogenase